jgi:hypothetical protein
VECVTFSGGDFEYDPKNALPVANYSSEIEYEEGGGYIGGQHLDQLRLRVAGAFKSKLEQREKHEKSGQLGDVHIIAVGIGDLNPRVLGDNLSNDLDVRSLFYLLKLRV